jgi:hypothetical protein
MNANITATGAMIALGLTYFNTKNRLVEIQNLFISDTDIIDRIIM